MARTFTVRCVGRRKIEISKLPGKKIQMVLKWRETRTLCGLVFDADEAQKLKAAVNDLVVTP